MLAFQLSDDGRTIEIICDDAGIDSLVGVLLGLKGSGSHVHLYTPASANDKFAKLSATTPFGDPAVGEVIISHGGDRD